MKKKKLGMLVLAMALILGGCSQTPVEHEEGITGGETQEEISTEEAVEPFVIYCGDSLTAAFFRQFQQEHPSAGEKMQIVEVSEEQMQAWQTGTLPEDAKMPDLVTVSSELLEELAAGGLIQPAANAGIEESDLEQMYAFMTDMGQVEDTIYGLTWQQTAKKFLYNRTLALDLLEVENGDGMQNAVGEWSAFYSAAKAVKEQSEGRVCLVSSAAEVREAFLSATPSWYEEEAFRIPDVMMDFMEIYPDILENGLTWSTETDSQKMLAGLLDGTTAGCFADAYFIRQVLEKTGGVKEGEWGICYGPQTYADEAQMLAVTADCSDMTLAGELLTYLTCDKKAMEKFALEELVPVNHMGVMEKLSDGDEGRDPLLKNQNIYKEYTASAAKIELTEVTDEDLLYKVLFLKEIESCLNGERDIEEALEHFEKMVNGL